MADKPDSFIPTRESLLSRLKDLEDQDSWREFFQIYRQLIYSMAIRAGLTEPEAEDVLQETLISVAETIQAYQYDRKRCRFKSWLGHLTQKRIADCYRRRSREQPMAPRQKGEGSGTAPLERVPDPDSLNLDAVWEEEWRQKLMEAAIRKVKGQVNAEQYQMFDLYALRQMPVRKVAAALGSSVGRVYLAKHRITGLIKKETKRLEAEMA